MMVDKRDIKRVAIYLRKSRVEETEKDLLNHKLLLEGICREKNWSYDLYMENGSSTSQDIEVREEFTKMLNNLSTYQGVLVVEQARISRSLEDGAVVKRLFKKAGVYLIIQQHIWDLSDPTYSKIYDFNSLMGSVEYSDTNARLQLGKQMRAIQGYWTNGPAPYGYYYDRNSRKLEINELEKEVYDYIKSRFLVDEWSTNQICYDLNKNGKTNAYWLTRKGNKWKNKGLIDLITNMTHMGVVVRGKEQGSRHKNKQGKSSAPYRKMDKDDWKVYEGKHDPLKTKEEHLMVLYRLQNSRICNSAVPRVKAKSIYSLTGLIVCGVCGHVAGVIKRGDSGTYIKKCHYIDGYGIRCPNSGINIKVVEEYLFENIKEQMTTVMQITQNEQYREELINLRETRLNEMQIRLAAIEYEITRINDAYVSGVFSMDEFAIMKKDRVRELEEIEINLAALKAKEDKLITSLGQDRIERYKAAFEEYKKENTTDDRKNELLHSIIDKIIYTRPNAEKGDGFEIEIKYK